MNIPTTHLPIKVLITDDHPVVRSGYRRMLENEPDISVVAEANDGETGFEMYKEYEPDVMILDLSMPGIGGFEALRRVRAFDSEARILVFSIHNCEINIERALEAGASGYLNKQSGIENMVTAVREVAQGKIFIDYNYTVSEPQTHDLLNLLSSREFQIFKFLAQGFETPKIAETLSISPKTVGVHHTRIMSKLECKNSAQLALIALRSNVIEP
ncbi:MAG: response regulator transcription factor [Gallionella sp.]